VPSNIPGLKALLFDVFGTVVDWRTSITRELVAFGLEKGIAADWYRFTDDWRARYKPSLDEVRAGRRPWTILDQLHSESLEEVVAKHGIVGLSDNDKQRLVTVWHRLDPWPDSVSGLRRLKTRYIIGTLSNGNVGLLVRMAKHAGLPWDVILGAETARAYKPAPEAYLRNIELLNCAPSEVMLVAAHNYDLEAAAGHGMRTAFVARPTEDGPNQKIDFAATGAWDIVTDSFHGVADALGCPA
jgi:2-haloacid dehalogenase